MPEKKTLERARKDARKVSLLPHRPGNLFEKRWSISAKASTGLAPRSRRLRWGSQKPGELG